MPTFDIDALISITIRPASRIGTNLFDAEAMIYSRTTNALLGNTSGTGETPLKAERAALTKAKDEARRLA